MNTCASASGDVIKFVSEQHVFGTARSVEQRQVLAGSTAGDGDRGPRRLL
ncbi:MAG: hypothetical protein QOC80_1683 [Frankiaceae bacterium]|jgi:hypothetical protein|nr:hypothetical protein [Frankiaceae bacterium]